jgi:hypothetical protein
MTHNLSPQTDARGVVVSECKPSSLEGYERAYKVKITSTKNKKLTDSSDKNFTITK